MLKIANTLILNYIAQIVSIVVNVLLLPAYSKYVGGEIIGLIGVVGVLTTWTSLIESAVASVVTREIAKHISKNEATEQISIVFKSMLLFVVLLSSVVLFLLIIGLQTVLLSGVLFRQGDAVAVHGSVVPISLIVALRLIEVFYKSALIGTGLITQMNKVVIIATLFRGALIAIIGVFGFLTIKIFFVIQMFFGATLVWVYAVIVYRKLPKEYFGINRNLMPLKGLWMFSSGVLFHNLLVVLTGQLDKIIAIRLTSLVEFGYYTLATSGAGVITMIVSPISQIYYPKISQIAHTHQSSAMHLMINEAGLVVVALAGTATCVGVMYAEVYFKLWLGSMGSEATIIYVFRIITIANLISGFLWIPNLVQFAKDNTVTSIKTYIFSLPIQVLALYILAPMYGAAGCAASLLIGNCIALIVYLFHFNKEVLALKFGEYVLNRHLIPIAKMGLIVLLVYHFTPRFSNVLFDAIVSLFAAIACVFVVVPINLLKSILSKTGHS